jgi:hypothetical protein
MGNEETSRKVLVHHDIVGDGNKLDWMQMQTTSRCLVLFSVNSLAKVFVFNVLLQCLASVMLIAILKETSCHVLISLCRNLVAKLYLRT